MPPFVLPVLTIVISLAALVWSADRFVTGSAALARHFKVSPLLIGMIIIGFGTSAPEMLVSIIGVVENQPGIVFGNAYGSNITNIALILGISALIRPIRVHSKVITEELPILAGISLLTIGLLDGGIFSRVDAIILLLVFVILIMRTIRQARWQPFDALAQEPFTTKPTPELCSKKTAIIITVLGLVILVVSARFFVTGAIELARLLGISELVIGLTIVAVGTSLPELVSSVVATLKGEDDLALGNIIGSNIFNTLAVVGVAGIIRPMPVAPEIISRDLPIMNAVTLSLFLFCYRFNKGSFGRINRLEGGVLLTVFVVYTLYICLAG